MIVNKFNLIIFISFFYFISCDNNSKNELEEPYKVLNKVLNDFELESVITPSFAPPPSGIYTYTQKDSLDIYVHFYKEYSKKKTISIESEVLEISLEELNKSRDCKHTYNTNNFLFFKNFNFIEYKYLSSTKNNIISNKTTQNKETDVYLSFSNVVFNKSYDKAVVKFSAKFSKLNGFTSLIYLEKEHFFWKIVCEKNITIS